MLPLLLVGFIGGHFIGRRSAPPSPTNPAETVMKKRGQPGQMKFKGIPISPGTSATYKNKRPASADEDPANLQAKFFGTFKKPVIGSTRSLGYKAPVLVKTPLRK